ncbi:MAG: hypothetical protein RSE58_08225, partial [Clostridia bacterium]
MFTDFPSIGFTFNNSGANAAIMQYVQETWNQAGITGTINAEAENILMATGSVAPMYFYTNPYMLKPNVKNAML